MYTYTCKILRVVDGDTLEVLIDLGFNAFLKETIRLLGVNTPEVFGAKASPEGKIASEYTKKWIADREGKGTFVYLSSKYNSREKYGRCLGVISFGDESLNDALISQGWAG